MPQEMGFHRQWTMTVENPDNVTHRQLLSLTKFDGGLLHLRRLADNIWLLAHDNNNNYCQRLYNCWLTQKNEEELLVSNVRRRQAGTQTHMWTYLEMCSVQVSYWQFSTVTELSSPSCYLSSVASPTRKDDQSSAKHTLNSATILYSV